MRILIIDEDIIARQILKDELDRMDDVEIVGQVANSAASTLAYAHFAPDLVILGVRTPGSDALRAMEALPSRRQPFFVIVAAFPDLAVEAFEKGAIDYLLKPVKEARLRQAVERACSLKAKLARTTASEAPGTNLSVARTPLPPQPRIIGRDGEEYVLLDPQEIVAFQAERDWVWILTGKQKLLASLTLRTIESRIKHLPFQRVHRNALVNIHHVRKMSVLSSQRWLLTLSNSMEVVVSKRQAQTVQQVLNR